MWKVAIPNLYIVLITSIKMFLVCLLDMPAHHMPCRAGARQRREGQRNRMHLLGALQRGHDDNLVLDASNSDNLAEGVVRPLCEATGRQRECEAPSGGHHHIQRHHSHERTELLPCRHALCPLPNTAAVSVAAKPMPHCLFRKLCGYDCCATADSRAHCYLHHTRDIATKW